MTAMAESGLGTFTEFDSASKIDFLSINYTPYIEENGLAGVLATNLSVIDTGNGLEPDSDGDGLTDAQERALGTCVVAGLPGSKCSDPADSDGDGYTDLFEERNRVSGFDPLDANKPLIPCASKNDPNNPSKNDPNNPNPDLDGDLLRDCEEAFLKTDPRLPDSDGDRIPDGLEFRAGMDPLDRTDAFGDIDRDGERNLDEVTAHTNPSVASPPGYQPVRYLYDVAPFTKVTGERCYHLDVRHIKLLTTGRGTNALTAGNDPNAKLGVNRVLLYFDEAPVGRVLDYGNVRVACADVRFVDGAVKSPSDGVVPLIERCPQVPACPPPPPCMDFKPARSFVQLPFSKSQWSAGDCKNLTSICPPPDAGVP
jgi:hypothetical protein